MTTADDQLAASYGMQPKHAERLRKFCQGVFKGKKLLIVVRKGKQAGLQWHGRPDYRPKPVTIKATTDATGSLTVDGQKYYPDYDMQGIYELRDTAPPTYYRFFAGNWVSMDEESVAKLAAREPSLKGTGTLEIGSVELHKFIREINRFVCAGDAPMFQHGAQDGYLVAGRPVLDAGDGFLVFEPDGSMRAIATRSELRAYYLKHRINWSYRD